MDKSRKDIERYLKGTMSSEERHRLEKQALSDPFLSDALEGAESVSPSSFQEDMNELRTKLRRRQTSRIALLGIAASVLVLLGIGSLVYYYSNQENPTIAENNKAQGPGITDTMQSKRDSVPLLTLAQPATTESKKASPQPEIEKSTALGQTNKPVPTAQLDQTDTGEEVLSLKEKESKADEMVMEKSAQPEIQSGAGARREDASKMARSLVKEETVKGTVTSLEDGSPIPGVNVVVKGTPMGTVTDIHGMYSLPVPKDKSSLIFSFVGMQTKEVNRQGEQVIDVKLSEDMSQLSEVVVAGKPAKDASLHEPVINLASPVGGLKAYNQYLENNLRYPQKALDNKIKGKVTVAFTVTAEGLLTEFNVVKGLGYGCDEEVIRLVREGPKWIPSTEDNVPVESEVKVKMKFDPAKVER